MPSPHALNSGLSNESGVQTAFLDNGLSVLTERMPTGNAAIGLWIHVGTRDEPEDASGVAHLIEHMLFKGTPSRDAFQLASAFEDVGGRLNAHTSREQTAYYARVLPDDAGLAVELFADMLQHSLYDEAELARERDVIVQEIGQTYDQPDELLQDKLHQAIYPEQIFGRPLLGDADSIAAMPREKLINYVSKHYNAGNISLVATGDIDHAEIVRLAEKFCATIPAGQRSPRQAPRYQPHTMTIEKELEQVNLALYWPGTSYADPLTPALNIMAQALGDGFSSRLWQEVREKRGLVYSIASGGMQWLDTGLFGIYASATPENCAEVLEITAREMKDFATTLTTQEIARAKTQLIANLTMDLEGTLERAEHLGHYWQIYGRVPSRAELITQFTAVSDDDVRRAAASVAKGALSDGYIGPLEQANLPNLRQLLAA